MAKLFNIVLVILGISSLINGILHLDSSIFLAIVNILAAIILLYVGIKMLRAGKEEQNNHNN